MHGSTKTLRSEGRALLCLLDARELRLAIQFMTRLAQGHAKDWGPLGTVLGVEDEGRGEGESSCSLTLTGIHENPIGLGHGCVTFALMDFGMGYGLKTVIRPEQWCASQEVSIRFLRPVRRTRLVCHSQVVDIGGDLAQLRSQVLNGSGQAVAEATGLYRLFESGRRSFKPALAAEAEREEMRR